MNANKMEWLNYLIVILLIIIILMLSYSLFFSKLVIFNKKPVENHKLSKEEIEKMEKKLNELDINLDDILEELD